MTNKRTAEELATIYEQGWGLGNIISVKLRELAAEIEQLKADLAKMHEASDVRDDEILAEAAAEIKRLKAALEAAQSDAAIVHSREQHSARERRQLAEQRPLGHDPMVHE